MEIYVRAKYGNGFSKSIPVTRKTLVRESNAFIKAGYEVFLHLERPAGKKKYQLGDTWGVDRVGATAKGKRVHRYFNDREDLDMVDEAINRGCK